MELKIVNETGLSEALIGMKFSFQPECSIKDIKTIINYHEDDNTEFEWIYDAKLEEKYLETAKKLCKRDGGHNKLLEQVQVWMIIKAPMDWWKQFDTYRVGMSKLSKSTMHTAMKKTIVAEDFDELVDSRVLDIVEEYRVAGDFLKVSKNLPQGFLQTRMVNTNYKVLRNIIMQRKGHKLPEWEYFIEEMFKQLDSRELLGIKYPFDFVAAGSGGKNGV